MTCPPRSAYKKPKISDYVSRKTVRHTSKNQFQHTKTRFSQFLYAKLSQKLKNPRVFFQNLPKNRAFLLTKIQKSPIL